MCYTDDICDVSDGAVPLEERAIAAVTAERLHACLAMLPQNERDIVDALYFDGVTVKELAARLKIPRTTLTDRRERIIRSLRRSLNS